jgi:fumarate reductase iron-sulfur subunit
MRYITVKVRRYNNEKGVYMEEFAVPFEKDMTVLDAITNIKDNQDGTLTCRWSCRMGMCGSCSAMVNGRPVLMCSTEAEKILKNEKMTVEPLRNFPVIKDLVVDIDDAMEKIRSVMPYTTMMEREAIEQGANLQSPKDRKKIDQTSQCIKCMLCYSACPVYGMDKDFVGPAASATAYRYQQDSREKSKSAKKRRMDRLTADDGIWNCSFVGECSKVCPKKVDPAMAIQRLKVQGILHIQKKLINPNV